MRPLIDRVRTLLKWSERYTRVDMVYLFRGGTTLASADVALAFVSLGLSVLIAAFVPKETYGIYRYVLSMTAIAAAFSLTGMNLAVTRAVALGHEGAFAKSLPVQAKYAIFQFAIAAAVSGYYFVMGNMMYGLAFAVVAVAAPASGVCNTYVAYLNGKKDFSKIASWRIQSGIVNALAIGAVVLTSPTLILLTLAYFISNLAMNAWFLWRTFRTYRPSTTYESEDLSYGKHLSIMNGVNILSSQLDSILLYHLLGPVALAIYSFAILIPERIRSFLNFLPTIILPRLAGKSRDELRATVDHRLWLLFAVTLGMAAVYGLAVPYFFAIFYPEYLDAVPYAILAGLLTLAVVPKYISTAFTAEGSHRALYIISLSTPILKIVLSLACIPLFGIWGAIWARIGAGIFAGVISYVLFQKPRG